MAAPISNLSSTYTIVKQEGLEYDTIRLDFKRRIFTDHESDYYHIHKYKIHGDSFDLDGYIEYKGNILKYMNNKLPMGDGVYIGGYDPGVPPQFINIGTNIQKGAQYILDQDVESGYIYIYEMLYQYEGKQYSIIDIGSLEAVPFVRAADLVKAKRRCLNHRNIRYRGQHPTHKYRANFTETAQDLKTWYDEIARLTTVVDNVILYDEQLFKIYAMEDIIRYIIEEGTAYGYGVGKYGAKGGYGI